MLTQLTEQLLTGQALSSGQISEAVTQLVSETVSSEVKADFLSGLARKGETTEEIAGFARELRKRSVEPPLDASVRAGVILDVCGTGGDQLHTFNISTTVALIAAADGLPVAKHGNRAITSKSGSADVLEALGVRVDLAPEQAADWLRDFHFAFFFAPLYHPAFRQIAPARKLCAERGQRTLFNFLGPLLNPARPTAQLIGVPRPELCRPVAQVLQSLGIGRGMVVCGQVPPDLHMDEFSTLGPTSLAEFYHERGFAESTFSPAVLPLQPATLESLAGGDREANATIIRRLLRGEERGPQRDAVLLNTAAALFVAGRAENLAAGWERAGALIDDGHAWSKLNTLIEASKTSSSGAG